MKNPKKQLEQKKLSLRVSLQLHDELLSAAESNGWSVNAEINHRLRAGPILNHIRELSLELAEVKAALRVLQDAQQ